MKALSCLVLVSTVALAGSAAAAQSIKKTNADVPIVNGTVIYACVNTTTTGTVRLVVPGTVCVAGETPAQYQLNIHGAAGPQGPAGPQAPPDPPAPKAHPEHPEHPAPLAPPAPRDPPDPPDPRAPPEPFLPTSPASLICSAPAAIREEISALPSPASSATLFSPSTPTAAAPICRRTAVSCQSAKIPPCSASSAPGSAATAFRPSPFPTCARLPPPRCSTPSA
jgi:hypothetical protein